MTPAQVVAKTYPAPVRDLVTGVIGTWLLLAVYLDGWAHLNDVGTETFFTPWHTALYAGLGMIGIWMALLMRRGRRQGLPLRHSLPKGYRGTLLGIGLFALGGLLDLAWHELFGIEVALDALVSPTHLLLGAGGMLILGTGVRSQRAVRPSRPWAAPAMLSLLLVTGLAAFFLVYTSAFMFSAPLMEFVPVPEGAPGHEEAELPVIAALGGYIVTTMLLIVPILYVLASGSRIPRLTVTAVVSTVAWLSVGIASLPSAAVAGALGATVAAVLTDLALARVPVELTRRWLPVAAAGIAVFIWAGQLAGLAIAEGLGWPVSLWAGVVALSAGVAAGLAAPSSAVPEL
ncbi:hypothetical protein [Crystallibacter degradans]|uniref:hypothetical protein n=1 Tax=Crystallibacter degradans TaxID=2726743 RepID=UPI003211DD6B